MAVDHLDFDSTKSFLRTVKSAYNPLLPMLAFKPEVLLYNEPQSIVQEASVGMDKGGLQSVSALANVDVSFSETRRKILSP